MASHRYWRLYITSNYGAAATTVTDVNLYSPEGVVLNTVVGNGAATASTSEGGTSPASAFDNTAGTQWQSTAGDMPCWVKWTFPAATDVDIVSLKNYSGNATFFPQAVMFQHSDDDSTWTDYGGFTNPNTLSATTYFIPTRSVTAAISLPMLTLSATGGAHIAGSLPMLTVSAGMGASAEIALPMVTLQSDMGMQAAVSLPMLDFYAAGHDSSGENYIELTLPMLTLEAHCGAQISATLPALTLEAEMTGSALITVDIALPMLTLDAEGTGSPYVVSADIAIPMLTLESWFGAGAAIDLPMLTVAAEMTQGGVLTATITLPMLTLESEATEQAHASLAITLPMLVPAARIAAGITLPMLQLESQITAVVAVTYEAYALNLNHKGFKDPVDELTRYTNFPFTQILRWGNAHYGVAADGLYLLGGATDYAATPTAIPWAWKTGMDDFGSATKKTITAAYFRGRMGPAVTVTLYPGEASSTGYSYTTTRGTDAQNYRQKFGLGVKTAYAALGASGDGELALDEIELAIAQLTRRI